MDDLPDPERPRPSTWPGTTVRSRSCSPDLQEEIPGTWPPVEHAYVPTFDPLIDFTGNHLTLEPPAKKSKEYAQFDISHPLSILFFCGRILT